MNALRLTAQRSLNTTSRAAFSTSSRVLAGKEDKLHTEGRAEEIEAHKQDALKAKKEGKQEWKDELASNSESIIKADRGETKTNAETIQKLQDESVKAAKK